MAQCTPGSNYISMYKDPGGTAIPVGAYMITGTSVIEIQ
jgi:hypothetical protein